MMSTPSATASSIALCRSAVEQLPRPTASFTVGADVTFWLSREVILEHLELRKVPEEQQSELLRNLEESEFSRFAPSSEKTDMNKLYSDAAQLIRNLENTLK